MIKANQHVQEINRQFDGTLNNFGPMVFVSNKEKNESYHFKDMLLQPYKSYFILATIKEVEAHETIIHWTIMKNSGVKNKHKNKHGKLNNILYIWYFKCKRYQMED